MASIMISVAAGLDGIDIAVARRLSGSITVSMYLGPPEPIGYVGTIVNAEIRVWCSCNLLSIL